MATTGIIFRTTFPKSRLQCPELPLLLRRGGVVLRATRGTACRICTSRRHLGSESAVPEQEGTTSSRTSTRARGRDGPPDGTGVTMADVNERGRTDISFRRQLPHNEGTQRPLHQQRIAPLRTGPRSSGWNMSLLDSGALLSTTTAMATWTCTFSIIRLTLTRR